METIKERYIEEKQTFEECAVKDNNGITDKPPPINQY